MINIRIKVRVRAVRSSDLQESTVETVWLTAATTVVVFVVLVYVIKK